MKKFRLLGRTTVFILVNYFYVLDDVRCVHGETADGKFQTNARVEDVMFL
jgi:hypothetical protein